MNLVQIITIIASILGSGGLSVIVTNIINARKTRSEAVINECEAGKIKTDTKITENDYINRKLTEISNSYQEESEVLRKNNRQLSNDINELNDKLQKIMQWVIYDNQKYRLWLESELRKLNPSIQFPECAPPPDIYCKECKCDS